MSGSEQIFSSEEHERITAAVRKAEKKTSGEIFTVVAQASDDYVFVSGFFFPVVPRGQARIRTQMNAALTTTELDRALTAFGKVGRKLGVIT